MQVVPIPPTACPENKFDKVFVPPTETDVGNVVNLENIIGSAANIAKKVAPKIVILDKILVKYFFVSSPGLIPGIYPPFSCRFFENSSGKMTKEKRSTTEKNSN